ncbi:MAG: DNA topoisomerase IV subunit A [Proteobacteria bacterium]|nr:DNA topoisomerase IV subunit A [Pseudomonadota bacterium]
MSSLEPLMRQNFLEYASYVIIDRAIPELRDGLKPVQRRLLYTLWGSDDGRFHKVANVIGETMKLHPHGDASIGEALVVLANKELFIEKQGNFGSVLTGHRAAAPRYIECRLTDLARETMFSEALTEYVDSYDGRKREPVALPAKLPVALLLGNEGIAVGMATRLLPHNLGELWQAQIALLRHEPIHLLPDFPGGGLMDASDYDDGRGRVRVRARLEERGDKKLAITAVPYGTTTESLIASIEAAAQKGRVKIAAIDDFTAEHVEIEVSLPRGVSTAEVIPQLYAYTECEVSCNSNMVMIRDRHPVELTVSETLRLLTAQLQAQLQAELEHELGQLEDRRHWLTLEQIFIEQRVYKRLESAKTEALLRSETYAGMAPYAERFVRPMVDEDVARLLALPIRRISAFDIEKHRRTIGEVEARMKELRAKLRQMTKTTIAYVQGLLKKYGERFPRRTEITTFDTVDKRAVARQNVKVSYDAEGSFFGSAVRGNEYQLTVSEYDRILAISSDGSYRIMAPPEKVLLPAKVIYCQLFDSEAGASFLVVYRDAQRFAYGKRVQIQSFVRDREYQLIKDAGGRIELLLPADAQGQLQLRYPPAKRQRVNESFFPLADIALVGVAARGQRLAPKPVAKVHWLREVAERWREGRGRGPRASRPGALLAPSVVRRTQAGHRPLLRVCRSASPSVMARVNLTLDSVSYGKLSRYAKASGTPQATAARRLLCEALERREARARRARLAADYADGRSDAKELLDDLEAAELELLGDEDEER